MSSILTIAVSAKPASVIGGKRTASKALRIVTYGVITQMPSSRPLVYKMSETTIMTHGGIRSSIEEHYPNVRAATAAIAFCP